MAHLHSKTEIYDAQLSATEQKADSAESSCIMGGFGAKECMGEVRDSNLRVKYATLTIFETHTVLMCTIKLYTQQTAYI